MESRVEKMEEVVASVREKVVVMGTQMEEMNQRMEGLEASVETIKSYLKDLWESTVGRETLE